MQHADIEVIKQAIHESDFSSVSKQPLDEYLTTLLEDESGVELIIALRDHKQVNDEKIFQQLIFPMLINLQDGEWQGKTAQLLNALAKTTRDGSLALADSEDIWRYANDYSLPVIKALIQINADIDHNALLATTFSGDHDVEYRLFDFIIKHFAEFSPAALAAACATVVSREPFTADEETEQQDQRVITTLLEHGANLDTCFTDRPVWSGWHTDCISLFGAFLIHRPELLQNLPQVDESYIPSPDAWEKMDWDFLVCEGEFNHNHLAAINALISRGTQLPVNEIRTALINNGLSDFASALLSSDN